MRQKAVVNAVRKGNEEHKEFFLSFQAKLLKALQRRGLLTQEQLEKGLGNLRERR